MDPPNRVRRASSRNKSAKANVLRESNNGHRAGPFVVDMKESSQVVEIAERFFFGLNARIETVPIMAPEDLKIGLSGVQGIIQRYG